MKDEIIAVGRSGAVLFLALSLVLIGNGIVSSHPHLATLVYDAAFFINGLHLGLSLTREK